MKCKIELQRIDRIRQRDQRYVASGTYLNGARFGKTDLVLEYSCQRLAMLKPLLFHKGDTSQILEEDDRKIDQKLTSKKKEV